MTCFAITFAIVWPTLLSLSSKTRLIVPSFGVWLKVLIVVVCTSFFPILRCQWSLQGFSKSGSQHGSAQRFHFFFVTSFPVQVSLLVYDAILIEIWREEILPHLLKTESSLSPLMIYSVVSCQNMNNNQLASHPGLHTKTKGPHLFSFLLPT